MVRVAGLPCDAPAARCVAVPLTAALRRTRIKKQYKAAEVPRLCAIDERGWLVPAEGTMARTVYDVLVAAQQCEEEFDCSVLAELLATTTNSIQATAWRIRRGAKSSRRSKPAHVRISRRNLQRREQIAADTPRGKLLKTDEIQKLPEAGRSPRKAAENKKRARRRSRKI